MSFDKILNAFVVGVLGVAALTTVFGRKNSPAVINSLGGAFSNSISSALGKGANIS